MLESWVSGWWIILIVFCILTLLTADVNDWEMGSGWLTSGAAVLQNWAGICENFSFFAKSAPLQISSRISHARISARWICWWLMARTEPFISYQGLQKLETSGQLELFSFPAQHRILPFNFLLYFILDGYFWFQADFLFLLHCFCSPMAVCSPTKGTRQKLANIFFYYTALFACHIHTNCSV